MRIYRIEVTRDTLLRMPEHERNFLIVAGHLLNELNVLSKLFYLCSQFTTDDRVVGKAHTTQALCMAKILAGKLAVGWEMLEKFYFRSRLSQEYDAVLSDGVLEAKQELGRYFGRSTNVISAIRNRFAFHYDPKQISEALSVPSEDEGWEMFLTEQSGNSLYFFSEVVVGHALLDHIDPKSHQAAMDRLVDDIISISGLFVTFLTGCLEVVSKRFLVDEEGSLPLEAIVIEDPPGIDDIQIPYFVLQPSKSK